SGSRASFRLPAGYVSYYGLGQPIQMRPGVVSPAAGTDEGSASPLPTGLRGDMERSFGTSFENVRVSESGRANAMGAQAFTQGENITFAPGQYSPSSAAGRDLIGHELTHVVQQRSGRVEVPQGKNAPINADPSLEREADEVGARAARGEHVGGAAISP